MSGSLLPSGHRDVVEDLGFFQAEKLTSALEKPWFLPMRNFLYKGIAIRCHKHINSPASIMIMGDMHGRCFFFRTFLRFLMYSNVIHSIWIEKNYLKVKFGALSETHGLFSTMVYLHTSGSNNWTRDTPMI